MTVHNPDINDENRVARECCTAPQPKNTEAPSNPDAPMYIELAVDGMTCNGCAARIETALAAVPGVVSVSADATAGSVRIVYQAQAVSPATLRPVVESAGYLVVDRSDDPQGRTHYQFSLRPVFLGLVSMVGVFAFYLGLITLTSDWYYATAQFSEYRWWLVALAGGLGIQVTLYTALRRWMKGKGLHAATTSMTASGGMSATAMAVCCTHYLAIFLPLVGLPFLSAAAAGLANYQVEFLAAGVFFNIFGVLLMMRQLKKNNIPLGAAIG